MVILPASRRLIASSRPVGLDSAPGIAISKLVHFQEFEASKPVSVSDDIIDLILIAITAADSPARAFCSYK